MACAMSASLPARGDARTGGYFRAALGAAYGEGHVRYRDASAPTDDAPSRPLSFTAPFGRSAITADLAAGFAPARGFVLAAEYGLLAQDLGEARFPYTTLGTLLLTHVGPLIDWYPSPSGPVHLELGVAYAWAVFSGDESGVANEENVVHLDDLNRSRGLFGHVGCGYVVRYGGFDVGPMLRTYGARLSSPHGETQTVGIGLWLSATSL